MAACCGRNKSGTRAEPLRFGEVTDSHEPIEVRAMVNLQGTTAGRRVWVVGSMVPECIEAGWMLPIVG